jgi:hypothetical protein
MAPKAQVTYYGRKPVDWIPDDVEQSVPAETEISGPSQSFSISDSQYLEATQSQSTPTNDQELVEAFRGYVRKELEDNETEYTPTNREKTVRAAEAKVLVLLLALTLNEESFSQHLTISGMNAHSSPEAYFRHQLILGREFVQWMEANWNSARPTAADLPKEDDRQREVKKWYDGRCILTGAQFPHGAHILPVRFTGSNRMENLWTRISMFWPSATVDKWKAVLEEGGYHRKNILPLRADAHGLWDRHQFAIRPVAHPEDPEHRIYLQMVWLTGFDRMRGVTYDNPKHEDISITDQRRGNEEAAPHIKTGDVYEVFTSDPAVNPLPSFELLSAPYAIHKVMSALKAAGSLKTIFKGSPPDVDPVTCAEVTVPDDWASLIEAATAAGVLDPTSAEQWGAAFELEAEAEAERAQRIVDAYFARRGVGET